MYVVWFFLFYSIRECKGSRYFHTDVLNEFILSQIDIIRKKITEIYIRWLYVYNIMKNNLSKNFSSSVWLK